MRYIASWCISAFAAAGCLSAVLRRVRRCVSVRIPVACFVANRQRRVWRRHCRLTVCCSPRAALLKWSTTRCTGATGLRHADGSMADDNHHQYAEFIPAGVNSELVEFRTNMAS